MLVARIEKLEQQLEKQHAAVSRLEARIRQQQAEIRGLTSQLRAITGSRIWQTLVKGGALLLGLQARWAHLRDMGPGRSGRITIDCSPPRVVDAAAGALSIRGRALAPEPLEWVQAGIDTEPLSAARVDDAGQFCWSFPVAHLSSGSHILRVCLRTLGGVETERRLPFAVSDPAAVRLDTPTTGPLISVVMPVYNTPERFLRASIGSVLSQSYRNWELCIADDASTEAHLRPLLESFVRLDGRIRVTYRNTNGHIAAATNTCLDMAQGEYTAFLDHDDELHPDALAAVASDLAANPRADWIYSDEDKIDTDGRRFDPFYKPDWSPEYLLGCMYTCHFSVYRTELIRAAGGLRGEFNGAQDYDLALRIAERTDRIRHIPRVLYHWRAHEESTASGGDAKQYAYDAATRALSSRLDRMGLNGEVLPGPRYGFHRIQYAIRSNPSVDIVIPTAGKIISYEGRRIDLMMQCVESINARSSWNNRRIIVIHNGDLDAQTRSFLDGTAELVEYRGAPFNLAEKINLGVERCTGEYTVLLNDDIEVLSPDWLERLLEHAQQPGVGAVGSRLLFPDGTIQHAGVLLLAGNPCHPYYRHAAGDPGYFLGAQLARNYLAVTGACLMTRTSLFREAGGFDPVFPLNFNDVDYCLRLHRMGFRNVYTAAAELVHYESVSRGKGRGQVAETELATFHARWGQEYYLDPYYNPNLPMDYPYYAPSVPATSV